MISQILKLVISTKIREILTWQKFIYLRYDKASSINSKWLQTVNYTRRQTVLNARMSSMRSKAKLKKIKGWGMELFYSLLYKQTL